MLRDLNFEYVKEELWGDATDTQIESQISHIEGVANEWDESVEGVVFLFIQNNFKHWVCSQYYSSHRKLRVVQEKPQVIDEVMTFNPFSNKLDNVKVFNYGKTKFEVPLLLINGSVICTSLVQNLEPFKRGKVQRTIWDAFQSSAMNLDLTYSMMANNDIDSDDASKLNDLSILPSRAFIIPTSEIEKLREIVNRQMSLPQNAKRLEEVRLSATKSVQIDDAYKGLLTDDFWKLVKPHRTLASNVISSNTQLHKIIRALHENKPVITLYDYIEEIETLMRKSSTPTYENLAIANIRHKVNEICQEFVAINGQLVPITTNIGKRALKQSKPMRLSRRNISVLDINTGK